MQPAAGAGDGSRSSVPPETAKGAPPCLAFSSTAVAGPSPTAAPGRSPTGAAGHLLDGSSWTFADGSSWSLRRRQQLDLSQPPRPAGHRSGRLSLERCPRSTHGILSGLSPVGGVDHGVSPDPDLTAGCGAGPDRTRVLTAVARARCGRAWIHLRRARRRWTPQPLPVLGSGRPLRRLPRRRGDPPARRVPPADQLDLAVRDPAGRRPVRASIPLTLLLVRLLAAATVAARAAPAAGQDRSSTSRCSPPRWRGVAVFYACSGATTSPTRSPGSPRSRRSPRCSR